MVNHGIIPGRLPTDWISGAFPWINRNPSADWRPFSVVGEKQYFSNFDTMSCVSFAVNNTGEIQTKHQTTIEINDSDRFLAKISNTTLQGNHVSTVLDARKFIGMVAETRWPKPPEPTTWDQYMVTIDPQVIKEAGNRKFIEDWQYEYVTDMSPANVRHEMQHAPLLITIPGHEITALYLEPDNSTLWILDDYIFNVDPAQPFERKIKLSDVTDIYKAVLTVKGIAMVGYKVQNDATVYVELGGKLVPIGDWSAFVALGGSSDSVVELTPEQFAKFAKVVSVLFKSN